MTGVKAKAVSSKIVAGAKRQVPSSVVVKSATARVAFLEAIHGPVGVPKKTFTKLFVWHLHNANQ